jgi:beta-galactosidase
MNVTKAGSTALLTRRDLLGRTARGVAALSVSPWLSRAEFMLPAEPGEPRTRDNFDFEWRFTRGDPSGAHEPDFADASWHAVDLPHDWSIEGSYSESEPASGPGGYLPTGIGWYRKRFTVPANDRDRIVTLEFDGVRTVKSGLTATRWASAPMDLFHSRTN